MNWVGRENSDYYNYPAVLLDVYLLVLIYNSLFSPLHMLDQSTLF